MTEVHTEYYVREGKEPGTTELTKFQGKTEPSAVYTVFQGKSNRWFCDCPAGANGRNCKHTGWVQLWISLGRPLQYLIRTDKKGKRV